MAKSVICSYPVLQGAGLGTVFMGLCGHHRHSARGMSTGLHFAEWIGLRGGIISEDGRSASPVWPVRWDPGRWAPALGLPFFSSGCFSASGGQGGVESP